MAVDLNENYDDSTLLSDYYPIIRDNLRAVAAEAESCMKVAQELSVPDEGTVPELDAGGRPRTVMLSGSITEIGGGQTSFSLRPYFCTGGESGSYTWQTPRWSDQMIRSVDIEDGAVTIHKIADGAVDEYKLDPEAVCERHLRDGAVTEDKVADGAITRNKIAGGDELYFANDTIPDSGGWLVADIMTGYPTLDGMVHSAWNHSITPKKIGLWINGTPIWRAAFNRTFEDQTVLDEIPDYGYYANVPVGNTEKMFIINGTAWLRRYEGPSFVDDIQSTHIKQGNFMFALPSAELSNMKVNVSGVYGYIDFVTEESNLN